VHEGNRTPTTQYPSPDSPLPSDLIPQEQLLAGQLSSVDLRSPTLSQFRGADIGYFASHAQAAFLLDRLLNIISSSLEREVLYAEITKLDDDVRSFLSLLMSEDRWARRFGCGAIAHSLRYVVIQGI
jgi:hypothetical protein